jgi:uncharacterized protein YoxC
MNPGQLAALIAAGFFAVLACVGVYVLIRLARLMTAVTGIVTQYSARADQLIEQAQAAIDRTNEQLVRTDAITASMDQVTSNMAELSGHVSALAGLARGLSSAVTAPVTGLSAVAYGVRRAMLVRRSLVAAEIGPEPGGRPAIEATVTGLPRSGVARSGVPGRRGGGTELRRDRARQS